MAFGSTRPRNMMPGHLSTNSDPVQLRNIKRLHARERKIERLRAEAARKGAKVYKLMGELKTKRTDYLAGVQLRKFHDAIKHLEVRGLGGVVLLLAGVRRVQRLTAGMPSCAIRNPSTGCGRQTRRALCETTAC